MEPIKEGDKAWLAGVIDVRGGFNITPARGKTSGFQIRVGFSSSEHILIREVADLFGVKMTKQIVSTNSRRGCKDHCPDEHVHIGRSVTYGAHAQGVTAAIVAHNTIPYLRLAQEEAGAAYIKYMASGFKLTGRGSWQFNRAVERMNSMGWTTPSPLKHAIQRA